MHKKLEHDHFCFCLNLAPTLPFPLTTQEHLPYIYPQHLPYLLLIFLISVQQVQPANTGRGGWSQEAIVKKRGTLPVRHVTGNDQDYLRKIPRVVVQKSALL